MLIQAMLHNVAYVLGVACGYYLAVEDWSRVGVIIAGLMGLCVAGHVVDTERIRWVVKEEGR